MQSLRPPVPDSVGNDALFGRRALPRVGIALPVSLRVAGLPGGLAGRTRDLGLSGLCVATPSCFSFGDLRSVYLETPGGPLRLGVEGRWQVEATGQDAFFTGVRLLEADEAIIDTLWDLVHERTKWLTRWLSRQPELVPLELGDFIELAHVTRLRDLCGGQMLYRQGQQRGHDESLFIVLNGRVGIELLTPSGRRVDVAEFGPGQIVGGAALVSDLEPQETCVACTDTTLLEISQGAYRNLLSVSPGLAFRLGAVATRCHSESLLSALRVAVDNGRRATG